MLLESEDSVHGEWTKQFYFTSFIATVSHEYSWIAWIEADNVDILKWVGNFLNELDLNFFFLFVFSIFKTNVKYLSVASAYHSFFVFIVHWDCCNCTCV